MVTKNDNPISRHDSTSALVRLSMVAPFLDLMTARRITIEKPLSRLGLDQVQVSNPDVFVHIEVMYGLLTELALAADDPFLGVHVGEDMDLSAWPPMARSMERSGLLVEVLTHLLESVPRHATSVVHSLNISADFSEYRLERTTDFVNSPAQSDGMAAALYIRIFQSLLSQTWDPARIAIHTAFPEAIPPSYRGVRIDHRPGRVFWQSNFRRHCCFRRST